MGPKRVEELAARLSSQPGRARLDFGHGRRSFDCLHPMKIGGSLLLWLIRVKSLQMREI